MRIKTNTGEFIKSIAECVSLKYDSNATPLLEICLEEGIDTFQDSYGSYFDGMTIYDREKFFIHLNTDRNNQFDSTKGRFTLAHELGHYFIDSHRNGLISGELSPHPSKIAFKQDSEIERQADYFAACLLMPEIKFKAEIHLKRFDSGIIDSLSTSFRVSKTASALRFADIGNHPIAVIYAEDNQIRWSYFSKDFEYKSLLNENIVPARTVMGEYFKKVNSNQYHEEEVNVRDWFKLTNREDYHITLTEYCITYQNKAMSILWEE